MADLQIFLWNKVIGNLTWDKVNQVASFAYDSTFLNSGIEVSPLHMPLSDRVYSFPNLPGSTFKGLPGLIADSLPDRFGKALIESYFSSKNYNLDDLSPCDMLAYIGKRGMGALEYQPDLGVDAKARVIDLSELNDLAEFGLRRAQQLNTTITSKFPRGFDDILSVGTSAGGARAKAVVALNETTGDIRSGQLNHGPEWSQWLIKMDVAKNSEMLDKPQGFGVIEYTYYQIATKAGIPMAECQIKEDGERRHFMTRRFDREADHKHHVNTLTGISHIDYEDLSSHSYDGLFRVARYLDVPYKDMEQLFKQMVFNVLMVNRDDHTKNFSFMMKQNLPKWRVSPAYDLAYAYDPNNPWVSKHMRINGKTSNIKWTDLLAEGKRHNISHPEKLAQQVLEASSQFMDLARKNDVFPNMATQIHSKMNEVYNELVVPQKNFFFNQSRDLRSTDNEISF